MSDTIHYVFDLCYDLSRESRTIRFYMICRIHRQIKLLRNIVDCSHDTTYHLAFEVIEFEKN